MPPPYPITGCPHRKLCGRLFFVPGRRRAAGGLSAGRFVYGMVCLRDCLRDCLWDGQFAAPESFQGRGQGRNRGTGQGNRETGNRGIGGGSPVGQWSVVSGQWSVVGSVGQSAAGLQAGCFRGGANGLFCVRRNIYGGFLAPCAITRYIYKSELKKQTDR